MTQPLHKKSAKSLLQERISRGNLAQRFRHSRRTRKPLTVWTMLPNMTTMLALCIGLSSVRFALLGRWNWAVGTILIAAILDAMDGRLARYLGSSSRFGAELDSFSDFVSFGVSPALVLYLSSLHHWDGKGWAVTLFFSVCMALRLARYNTISIEGKTPPWAKGFFIGVPAPAAAALALTPLILSMAFDSSFFLTPLYVAITLILVGLLMISNIPTFSLMRKRVPQKWAPLLMICVAFLAAGLFSEPWLTLSFLGVVYVSTFPFSLRAYQRLKKSSQTKRKKSAAPKGKSA